VKIREPHIKKYLGDFVAHAKIHEELIRTLGREPSDGRSPVAAALAKGGDLIADAVGLAGVVHGNWKDLRQLLIESRDTLGAFAILEQLGDALGLPELANPAFHPITVKRKDHLLNPGIQAGNAPNRDPHASRFLNIHSL